MRVAAAKEQNMRDHAEQVTAFLGVTSSAYKGPPITDDCMGRGTDYMFKGNGSHVPGCTGSCGVPGLHVNSRTMMGDNGEAKCMQLRANGKKVVSVILVHVQIVHVRKHLC